MTELKKMNTSNIRIYPPPRIKTVTIILLNQYN